MTKCLVTGGTGFIGSHLVKRLLDEGNEVRIFVRRPANQIFENLEVDVVYGDIRDRESVFRSVKGVDKVYHLAAVFRETKLPDRDYWTTNVDGTRNILEASIKEGVNRFLHCSTVGVHGHISEHPANEEAPFNPGDIYQKTKVEGEILAKAYHKREGLPVTIIRPAGIYGPGDLRFLRLFKAIKSGRFIMIGKGDVYYHMCYISDLIDGIIQASKRDEAIGETYILAGGKYTTLKYLVELIAKALKASPPKRSFPFFMPVYLASYIVEIIAKPFGLEPPIHRRRVDIFRKSRAFDITKAKKDLGYKPKVDLETGIKMTVEWYERMGYL